MLAATVAAAPAPRATATPPWATFTGAPTPAWAQQTSPGGTVTFYPLPGPASPMTLPPVPTVGLGPQPEPTTPPLRSAQPYTTTPAWDAWEAGRGASPQGQPPMPDAWAAAAAAADASQTQPGGPRHYEMNTPGGGGGKGGNPYPREMRIDARGWSTENKKLDVTTTFDGFQVWTDRALMFL